MRTLPLMRSSRYTSRAPWEGTAGVTAGTGHARLPPCPWPPGVSCWPRLPLELIVCDFYHDELLQVTQESGAMWRWHSEMGAVALPEP